MRVILDVFSGRPNPSWELSSWHIRELQGRLAEKTLPTTQKIHPKLGFRGLIVVSQTDDLVQLRLPAAFRLGAPAMAETSDERDKALSGDTETRDVACWLLQTAMGSVHPNLLAFAAEEIWRPLQTEVQESRISALQAPVAPPPCVQSTSYNTDYWNEPSVQPFNNCYNFATNFRSDTTAQPGRISGAHYSEFSCWNVGTAASYDGVRPICEVVSNFVALVIWPGVDFHWYRLQAEGFWAHKIGHGQATNLDSGDRVIQGDLTPESCRRGPYTLFCGYRYAPIGMHVV